MPRGSETRDQWRVAICRELLKLREETDSEKKVARRVHGTTIRQVEHSIKLPEVFTINDWVRACGSTLSKFYNRPELVRLAELKEKAQRLMDDELKRGNKEPPKTGSGDRRASSQ